MLTTEVKKRRQKLKRSTNPDNPSPSGDPYFDNPKNVEGILKRVKECKEGVGTMIKTDNDLKEFFDRL